MSEYIYQDVDKAKLKFDVTALTPHTPIYEYLYTLDLTVAHTLLEWPFLGAISITVVTVGTGTWNFRLDHTTNVQYLSTWFQNMDLVLREFNRIYFTNTAQEDVTNPVFLIGTRMRPVTWQL